MANFRPEQGPKTAKLSTRTSLTTSAVSRDTFPVVCENSADDLCGLTVIELEQAADSLATLHGTRADDRRLRRDELVPQTLVWPFFMIVLDKLSDGRLEMRLAEQHQAVQALRLGRLDKPFGVRVQIGTPRRENQRRYAAIAQQAPKGRGVQRVAIEDEMLNAAQEAVAGGGEIPSDLHHPGLVRLRRKSGDFHGAGLELHHEQDDVADEASQRQDLHGEEIGRREPVPVSGEERFPRRARAALWCRLDAVVLEDRLNGVAGDVVAERLEPTADARVPPGRVLLCHAEDQRDEVRVGAGATRTSRGRAIVFLRHERPIPPQDRVRCYDADDACKATPADGLAFHGQ